MIAIVVPIVIIAAGMTTDVTDTVDGATAGPAPVTASVDEGAPAPVIARPGPRASPGRGAGESREGSG